MVFTNHGSPEEKSQITHYENSNHASFSLFGMDPIKYDADNLGWAVIKCHGKLLMPPSLCFTQNQLNYVQMTSFCFCFSCSRPVTSTINFYTC